MVRLGSKSRTSGSVSVLKDGKVNKGSSLALRMLASLMLAQSVGACTNILVTREASDMGDTIISYNSDDVTMFGSVYHYPAMEVHNGTKVVFKGNSDGDKELTEVQEHYLNHMLRVDETTGRLMRQIYDWSTGDRRGEIPEANQTYNVVGNANEHGLIIAETTFTGVSILHGEGNNQNNMMDYGSLLYLSLQRCKTVHCAMDLMIELMDTYGYASEGESFSFADRTGEVWVMEMIGRGPTYPRKGAVYVAMQVPPGHVTMHSNHARIGTFPRNDTARVRYADDIVEVAVHYGLYPADADPEDFKFAAAFQPMIFTDMRADMARVWDVFSRISADEFRQRYESLVTGEDLTNTMPWSIAPSRKLTLQDVNDLMATHYEDTILDPTLDVGSGVYARPYRPRPLLWEYEGKTYFNERTIATYRTGWAFVGQIRHWMPAPLSTVLWYAMDDVSTSPRVPVYASSTAISPPYAGLGQQDGFIPQMMQFDVSKAFWVQNMVSNFVYGRWMDMYPVVKARLRELLLKHMDQINTTIDPEALKLYEEQGTDQAVAYVTDYAVKAGNLVHKQWQDFFGELFVQFRDFYTITPAGNGGCIAAEVGIPLATQQRIAQQTGTRYLVPGQQAKPADTKEVADKSSSADEPSESFLAVLHVVWELQNAHISIRF